MLTRSRLVFEKEAVRIPGIHAFGQYIHTAAGPGLPPHQHKDCVEITFMTKGFQAFRVGDAVYNVKGGEQYVSLPGELHDTAGQPEEKGICIWLILNVTEDRDNFLLVNRSTADKIIQGLHQLGSRHFVSHPESEITLIKAFKKLLQFRMPGESTGTFAGSGLSRPPSLSQEEQLICQLAVVSHLLSYLTQTIQASRATPQQTSPIIHAASEYITYHVDDWLSVTEIAEKLRVPESQLRQIFRREIGLTPAEYILRRKIDVAKTRLLRPGSHITEVAYSLGFSSSQYFATAFRRYTNLTPSEFLEGRSSKLKTVVEMPAKTRRAAARIPVTDDSSPVLACD